MSAHVELLKQLIAAETAWRDDLATKRSQGYIALGGDQSIDQMISAADARIRGHQMMIDHLTLKKS